MLLGSLARRANIPDLDLETEHVSTNQLFERVVMSTTAIDHQNSTSEITIRPLSDALGAEIIDLNGAHQLDADTFELVRRALQEHHVLCFRNQDLADEELIEFSRQFGSLEALPEKDKTKGKKELYNVANVSIEGGHLPEDDQRVIFQRNNARWHTDSSYRDIPSFASIMHGIEVLPDDAEGGETAFANMLLAYECLPDDMKRKLEPLHQVHSYGEIRRLEPAIPQCLPPSATRCPRSRIRSFGFIRIATMRVRSISRQIPVWKSAA
jgi:alpha-ketoglutarate-dependent taurine dioxygenase